MLQACFGEADVAAPAQTATADGLGMRALDPGSGGVAFPERLGFLVLARALQRFEVLACLQSDDAWLALGPGATRAQRAWEAVPGCEPRLKHHAVLGPGVRQPRYAFLARRAGHHLAVPIDVERGLGQPVIQGACQLGSSATGPMMVTS